MKPCFFFLFLFIFVCKRRTRIFCYNNFLSFDFDIFIYIYCKQRVEFSNHTRNICLHFTPVDPCHMQHTRLVILCATYVCFVRAKNIDINIVYIEMSRSRTRTSTHTGRKNTQYPYRIFFYTLLGKQLSTNALKGTPKPWTYQNILPFVATTLKLCTNCTSKYRLFVFVCVWECINLWRQIASRKMLNHRQPPTVPARRTTQTGDTGGL